MYGHFVFFACKYTLFCSSLPNGFYLIFSFLYYKVEKYEGICNYFGVEYKLESGDELLSSEYEELKKKDESQDKVIDAIGADILNNTKEIDYIKAQLATYDYIDENMPEWAIPTITKLVDKGFLKGDEEGKLGLTEDLIRMFIVNDRAGIYGA